MLSQTAEYALRAVVILAEDPDIPRTAQQVAEETNVPSRYLSKVLQTLGKAGLLHAQRGPRGGFTLARPPKDLTILEIVRAIDPLQRIDVCPLGRPGHERLCPLHRRINDAIGAIEQIFGQTSIADLLVEGDPDSALCQS